MKVFNGLKKLLMPSYCIHKIKWHFYKRKFGMIGQKCSMGRGFCLSGCSNIKFGDNVLCGDNVKLETWEFYNGSSTGYHPELLTFWNVPNYGTFAQAYALQKFIHALNEKRDCKQIAYLNQRHFDFYYSRLPRCNPFHKTFYRDLWNRAFPFSQYYKKKRSFLESYKKISHTKEMTAQELEQAKFDTVVLGSDIIWDYSFEIFDKDPFLFGSKLNAKKKISYAASFGTIKESEPIPEYVKKSLLDMDEISVRDLNSARIVEKIVGKKPEVVLDPTYLWDFTKDSNVIKPQYENYMVVYGQDFSENSIKEIINYAKENKLTLICLDCNNDNYSWCDITVRQCDLTPFEWIGYFRYC